MTDFYLYLCVCVYGPVCRCVHTCMSTCRDQKLLDCLELEFHAVGSCLTRVLKTELLLTSEPPIHPQSGIIKCRLLQCLTYQRTDRLKADAFKTLERWTQKRPSISEALSVGRASKKDQSFQGWGRRLRPDERWHSTILHKGIWYWKPLWEQNMPENDLHYKIRLRMFCFCFNWPGPGSAWSFWPMLPHKERTNLDTEPTQKQVKDFSIAHDTSPDVLP